MDLIEEVLRMRHECGRSHREIARAYGLSVAAANQLLQRATVAAWDGRCRRTRTRKCCRNGCTFGRRASGRGPEGTVPRGDAAAEPPQEPDVAAAVAVAGIREAHPDGYGYCHSRELLLQQAPRGLLRGLRASEGAGVPLGVRRSTGVAERRRERTERAGVGSGI